MTRREAFQFLCDCLAPPDTERGAPERLSTAMKTSPPDWPLLIRLSSEQRVTLLLYRCLLEKKLLADAGADLLQFFKTLHAMNSTRNTGIRMQILAVCRTLNAVGIEPVVLKGGAHLLTGLYADPAVRVLADIDMLAPAAEYEAGKAALVQAGYAPVIYENRFDADPHHDAPLVSEGAPAPLELHVELLDSRFRGLLPAAEALARSERMTGNVAVWRKLCAQDEIAYHIAHVQLHHDYFGIGRLALRELCDLSFLRKAHDPNLDWQAISTLYARQKVRPALESFLLQAERYLACPMPPDMESSRAARQGCRRVESSIVNPRREQCRRLRHELSRQLRQAVTNPAYALRLFKGVFRPSAWRGYTAWMKQKLG